MKAMVWVDEDDNALKEGCRKGRRIGDTGEGARVP